MTSKEKVLSLQDVIDNNSSIVDVLYGNPKGSVVRDAVLRQPTQFVSPEFTNWRDEQRAWSNTVALYDQSYHMTTTTVRGKDALEFFSATGVNGFSTFSQDKARHYVCCSPSGRVIGDGILYWTNPEDIALVGRAAGHNWLEYQAEVGSWDVELERDEIFSKNPAGRREVYRYQIEGPQASTLLQVLTGESLPESRTFDIITLQIAGHRVFALRHTMAGGSGFELWGPWDEGAEIKNALVSVGEDLGLRQVGSMAYFTTAVELGWIPRPMPAIFSGDDMRGFREWLPATAEEVGWSLGGSFYSRDIEDYYFSPADIGYAHLVKFNHDFIGREALESALDEPHRSKVTLRWNPDDLGRLFASYASLDDLPGKYIDLPRATYATWQYDTLTDANGECVGVSTYPCMSWNERAMLTLGVVEPTHAQVGNELTLVWGEPRDGALSAPWLEPHRQMDIRATVTKVHED